MKRIFLLLLSYVFITATANGQTNPPVKPYGALPSDDQMRWQKMEYYMFIHFGPNTFTDKEWGDGREDPKVFNPTNLDARQWARTAKEARMKAIIITAKHHDGFSLWPSQYSTHTVRESGWKNGKGDILKELSDACREYGLKFGVYLSPWDQNHPDYGTEKYNQIFANTLKEVLTSYGEVFEVWFDGANGEGPNGKTQEYDWELFHKTVYEHQPQAIIFSDIGPGTRWIGNESGYAGETNWSTLNIEGFGVGKNAPPQKVLNTGNENGTHWIPGEADVSVRPGWFFSPHSNDKVKTLSQLLTIYYSSVGRNANLLLNVPVSREGLIHKNDSTALMELRQVLDESFKTNLALGKEVVVSVNKPFSKNLTDGDFESYWAAPEKDLTASLLVDLGEETTINRLLLQEYIPMGQRVKAFRVEYWNGSSFVELDRQTTIGYKRILKFPTVRTNKLQIHLEANAAPVLSEIQLYFAPEISEQSGGSAANSGFSTKKWKAVGMPASLKPQNAFDGDSKSLVVIRNAKDEEQHFTVDMGKVLDVSGFTYTPSTAEEQDGNIYRYNFMVSTDGRNWTNLIENGVFGNIKNNPIMQQISFGKPHKARYIKLQSLQSADGNRNKTTIAELGVIVSQKEN